MHFGIRRKTFTHPQRVFENTWVRVVGKHVKHVLRFQNLQAMQQIECMDASAWRHGLAQKISQRGQHARVVDTPLKQQASRCFTLPCIASIQ